MTEANGQGAARQAEPGEFDLVVVGAGFAGMYMLHKARGLGLRTRVYERGADVGGTWYWNRYPGARCDIESLEYSFGFDEALQQEWHWTERFATQPEILRYAGHIAERFGLRRDIRFDTRVDSAHFDEADGRWLVRTDRGDTVRARFVVMATGCLSTTNLPGIPGIGDFLGPIYHTGQWPHEPVDFHGRRVGVIGTGSSAIQSIPVIAGEAVSVHVFQRTPNYSVPAHNAPLDPAREARIKAQYRAFRARNRLKPGAYGSEAPEPPGAVLEADEATREAVFEQWWQRGGLGFMRAFTDLMLDARANEYAAQFVRRKIREIVRDPATADLLSPDQAIGCKRLCVDTGYYDAFNKPNVHLVDIRSAPIERITASGVRTSSADYPVDALVFATGFDAMTGTLTRIDVRGRGGVALRDKWAPGPRAYLGLSVAGFPNLFTITGPGSPSVLTNMLVSIEQHVEFVADAIAHLRAHEKTRIEAKPEAEEAWVAHVNQVASATLYPSGCNSWYLGANVPGKPRVFMPLIGFPPYEQKCREVVANGYEGFALS